MGARSKPRVEVRRSERRRRTVSAYRDGEKIVVLVPASFTVAEERDWVTKMVARVQRKELRQLAPRKWIAEDLKKRAELLEEIAQRRPKTKLIKAKAASAMNLVAEEKEVGQTLLAVGTRGLSAPKRVLLGSVSTETLRAADGSVLIVPSERTSMRDRAMVQGANGA